MEITIISSLLVAPPPVPANYLMALTSEVSGGVLQRGLQTDHSVEPLPSLSSDNGSNSPDANGDPSLSRATRTFSTFDNPGLPEEILSDEFGNENLEWRDVIVNFSPV